MSANETGQITSNAAEIYEEFFVPALFQEWTERVIDAASIRPGNRVLDVACGTGVLARTAAERVGVDGVVIGLDVNPGMLAVAERKGPAITWRQGRAESLPFADAEFDAVVSQFALMFFDDRVAALEEMRRVVRPNGRVAVAVWGSIEETPGYSSMSDLLRRLFGEEAATSLSAPYSLGDREDVRSLFSRAGITDVAIQTIIGMARFPSIRSWVFTDIKGWTLADVLSDEQFATLLEHAERDMQPFVTSDGTVAFAAPAHIVTWTKGDR